MRALDKIHLEITSACNLRCAFCPPTRRAPAFLSRERFAELMVRLEGAAQAFYFHVKGEPLLHPELGDFIDMAGNAGFKARVTTNGTLLASRLEDLKGRKALERLNVSLHALEDMAEPGRSESLDAMLAAARELRASDPERRSLKTLSLRLWNRTDPERTAPLLARLERFFRREPGELAAALEGERGLTLEPGVSLHPAERFDWPSLAGAVPPGPVPGFCRGLRDQAGILVDGSVVPCCLDGEGDLLLGNIYEQDWKSIMEGERARAIYDGFSRREAVEPLCRSCGYRARF